MTNLHEKCDGNGGITSAKEVVFALVCESACLCVAVIGITPKKLLTNFDEFLDGALCDYQELISCWQ